MIGYNRYFTFDSPDFSYMTSGYQHISDSKIDVISVLKQYDAGVKKRKVQDGTTDIGCNYNPQYGSTANEKKHGIFHGRRFMPKATAPGKNMSTLHGGRPDYFYTKFITYDTKSFKYPKSLINLTKSSLIVLLS